MMKGRGWMTVITQKEWLTSGVECIYIFCTDVCVDMLRLRYVILGC